MTTLFAISGALIAISCTIMAGLVYFTNRAERVNRLWASLCLAVSLWGFGMMLVAGAREPGVALTCWRLIYLGVVFIPALFYHFVLAFTEQRRAQMLGGAYAVAGLFVAGVATRWFIPAVRPAFGLYYKTPGPLYHLFVFFFLGMAVLSYLELWRFLRAAKSRPQRQLVRWLIIGTAIGFAGGATAFLPAYGINVFPYGNFALPLFPLIMVYAFLRHRLMDVNRAVARLVTFLLIYVFVIGTPIFLGYYYRPLWAAVLGEWWWVAPLMLMGLLASASPVAFVTLSRELEQQLWQTQRRYHRTLIAASAGMTRIKDLRRLCGIITHMVNRTVGLTNALLFLYDPKEQRYALSAVRYPSLTPSTLTVAQDAPLIRYLQDTKDLILLTELQAQVEARRAEARGAAAAAIYEWMRKLEGRLIVPSFSNDRLLAFLVLGAKRSGEPYAIDDIAIFSGLANQAALAIENAMVFEELKTNEILIAQSEKLASLGQLASGMAHEIHNPLTIISGEAQLFLERFKQQDPKVDALLASIIEECKRAADITRRILRFAKPAAAELAPVDLKTAVEESLTLAGYQVRLERVERRVDVPDNLPKVRSNQNQLQEVLLNLILNACQAMGEKGGTLLVSARQNDATVVLKVEDNGPGISPGTLRKIFDPFYTTKASGTGLGLFVTQRIIKSHGGTIDVNSMEGAGTCFTIHLPIWSPSGTATNVN